MKSFSAEMTAEFLREAGAIFWLLEFQLDSDTYRYTDADIDLYYSGDKYTKYDFKIGEIKQSANFSIDKIKLDIADAGLGISSILLNEDAGNKTAILRICAINTGFSGDTLTDGSATITDGSEDLGDTGSLYQIIALEVFFTGFISGWTLKDPNSSITLSNEFMLWNKKTLRISAPSCPWYLGSTECGHADNTWCDQSWERCCQLGNQKNFGGKRFVQAMEGKKIYWGRR